MKGIIFTAHHKGDRSIDIFKKYFCPIHVGSALSDLDLGIMRDDSGINISEKNKNYCELTASYYALKNIDSEYFGLMHYRRFFLKKSFSFQDIKSFLKYCSYRFLGIFSILNLNLYLDNSIYLSNYLEFKKQASLFSSFFSGECSSEIDIFLPKKVKYAYLNVKQQYSINHCMHQFELFNEIILKKYPFFTDSIRKVNASKKIYPYNMYIMKKEYFFEYNSMLFDVLEDMEEKVSLDFMGPYQSRVFGFLSERFLNYYIEMLSVRSNVNIKELRTAFVRDEAL